MHFGLLEPLRLNAVLMEQDPNVKLIRELRAENARLRALLSDATVCAELFVLLFQHCIIRSTLPSPSTKSFFDFTEIWYVGRGRRVMHVGMQYDPIQGQGHEPSKVGNLATFKGYLVPHL